MLKSVEISNFKCFEKLRLCYSNLTLMTGFNSGGKSTALQSLLLLAQGMRADPSPTKRFPLNGPLVRLGAASDVLPWTGKSTSVSIQVESRDEVRLWNLVARPGERQLRFESTEQQVADSADEDSRPEESVIKTVSRLCFLGALRLGLSDDYPVPDVDTRRMPDVGFDGRFACFEYHRSADDEVPEARRHRAEPASSLRKQVDAWMGSLFSGAQADVQYFPQVSAFGLLFRGSEFSEWRRPANVGFGFTYAFPIIVALLTAKQNQLVIIDSPEAHLHPNAQSQMGRMLAHFAATGVQVVVETHSDHLLNGVRLAVREKVLTRQSLAVHFFSGVGEQGHGVVSPVVDEFGGLYEWPDGFFDQSEKDIARLAGWT